MLLKIGLELLAKHSYEVAISPRVNKARKFARHPGRGDRWWFSIYSDPSELLLQRPRRENAVEIFERDDRLFSTLSMPGVVTLVPLEDEASVLSVADYPEPHYRILWGKR